MTTLTKRMSELFEEKIKGRGVYPGLGFVTKNELQNLNRKVPSSARSKDDDKSAVYAITFKELG